MLSFVFALPLAALVDLLKLHLSATCFLGCHLQSILVPGQCESQALDFNTGDRNQEFNVMEANILDDLINIDCVYFVQMGDHIYHTPHTHSIKKAYASDIETSFSDLDLLISNGTISSKINDMCDEFDFVFF